MPDRVPNIHGGGNTKKLKKLGFRSFHFQIESGGGGSGIWGLSRNIHLLKYTQDNVQKCSSIKSQKFSGWNFENSYLQNEWTCCAKIWNQLVTWKILISPMRRKLLFFSFNIFTNYVLLRVQVLLHKKVKIAKKREIFALSRIFSKNYQYPIWVKIFRTLSCIFFHLENMNFWIFLRGKICDSIGKNRKYRLSEICYI